MVEFAIVIVGYNRLDSIQRLVHSLELAEYSMPVDLVFDLDHSDNPNVVEYANSYCWIHGDKLLRTYPERLGLRKHMIKIAELFDSYDALIILEDDICVSPDFFEYCVLSTAKYKNNDSIMGISMYNMRYHGNNFEPIRFGYDNYFIQAPTSWGQVWLKKQWREFVDWYEVNQNREIVEEYIPAGIRNYPPTSYLKYVCTYMIENNKYFSYPYVGFSTCFSDVGEHAKYSSSDFQTEMCLKTSNFSLAENIFDTVVYDAFFELHNKSLDLLLRTFKTIEIETNNLTMDLQGEKESIWKTKYVLTMKVCNYKIVKTFGLQMHPMEINIFYNIPGNAIFLYDTSIEKKNLYKTDGYNLITYIYGGGIKQGRILLMLLKEKIKILFRKYVFRR